MAERLSVAENSMAQMPNYWSRLIASCHGMLLAFGAMCLAVCSSCSTPTRQHHLRSISSPVTFGNVVISPRFLPSAENRTRTRWGSPWQLGIVSEAPSDVAELRIESAIVYSGDQTYCIVQEVDDWSRVYELTSSNDRYLNEDVGSKLAASIPSGQDCILKIVGVIVGKDGETAFQGKWEFRSEVIEGEVEMTEFITD